MIDLRTSRGLRTAGALLALAVKAASGAAQDTTIVSSTLACQSCTLSLVHTATLGAASDPYGLSDRFFYAARDRSGRYVVGSVGDQQLLRYDSTGKFSGTLSRGGQGPGEIGSFGGVTLDDHDSLFVMDRSNRRITIFAPNDSFVRSEPVPVAASSFAHSGNSWLLAAQVAGRMGQPLQLVRNGVHVRSFGVTVPDTRVECEQACERKVIAAANGGFLVGVSDRYQLEEWTEDARLRRVIIRQAEWFPPATYPAPTDIMAQPPNPLIKSIGLRRDGLWTVLVVVPDPNWKNTIPASLYYVHARDGYDTVIEILDPQSGRVLARTRSDEYLSGFMSQGEYAYSHRQTADGNTVVDVWRLSFSRAGH